MMPRRAPRLPAPRSRARAALAVAVSLGVLAVAGNAPGVSASSPPPAWTTTSAVRFDLRAVTCPDAMHCYAVGSNANTPVIEVSTDGGGSWNSEPLPVATGYLDSIFCLDVIDCWAAGRGDLGGVSVAGIDLFTHDGGSTWTAGTPITATQGTSTLPVYLGGISCVSMSQCWAVGDEVGDGTTQWRAEIWASSDGGATWPVTETITDPNVAVVTGLACVPGTSTCYATADTSADQSTATYAGTVLQRTVAGGQASWGDLPVPSGITNLAGLSCVAAAPSVCTAVGYSFNGTTSSAVAITSADGGATWSSGAVPPDVPLLDGVNCVSATTCWAVGYQGTGPAAAGQIVETADGGHTWLDQAPPPGTGYLDGIGCKPAGSCVAVGYDAQGGQDSAQVASNLSGSWQSVQSVPAETDWMGASCADTMHCVVVGNTPNGGPAIQATSTGGANWAGDPVPAGVSHLDAVSCPAANRCWAVGYAVNPPSGSSPSAFKTAVVISTSDGANWSVGTLPAGAASHLDGISCPTTSQCVAVGDVVTNPATLTSAAAILTTGNGSTWAARTAPAGVGYLAAVSCASSTACTAVGTASAGGAAAISTVSAPGGWSADVLQSAGGQTYDALVSVSCLPTLCAAAGSELAQVGTSNAQGQGLIMIASRPGGTWVPKAILANIGALFGVSCLAASPLNCVAGGNAISAGTEGPPAEAISSSLGGWVLDSIPADVPSLRGMACAPGSTRCLAMGKNVVLTTPAG